MVPLYEAVSDTERKASVREVALESLQKLGFEQRREASTPTLLVWGAGAALVIGSLVTVTAIGPLAIVPFFLGVALLLLSGLSQLRRAGKKGARYQAADGTELYIPDFGDRAGGTDGGGLPDVLSGAGGGEGSG